MQRLEWAYEHLPPLAQSAALTLFGHKLKRMRTGGRYWGLREELAALERRPLDHILRVQEACLLETISHAYKYVPFYRRQMDELKLKPRDFRSVADLEKLPMIGKSEMQQQWRELVSTATDFKRMYVASSGGTTGTSARVIYDPRGLQTQYAVQHQYQWRWAGVEFGDRWVMINGRRVVSLSQQEPPFWRFNAASNEFFFSCFHIREETIPLYLEKMADLDAALLHLYPSTASTLASYMKRHGLMGTVRPRAIITTSETLFPQVRSLIEEQFETKVYNLYGGDGAAQICECEHGGLHIAPLYGYVEFRPLPDSDIEGACEMVLTGLANRGTVLIRHRIGDVAVPGKAQCPCGRAIPTVEMVWGRTGDVIVTPEGNEINASNLTDVFKDTPKIRRGQFIQDEATRLMVRLEIWPGYSNKDERKLREEVHSRIGTRMKVDVEIVEEIPLTANGKFRFVINNTKGNNEVR